jgi:hypothetical protein
VLYFTSSLYAIINYLFLPSAHYMGALITNYCIINFYCGQTYLLLSKGYPVTFYNRKILLTKAAH